MRIVHIVDHFQPWMGYQETYLAKFQAQKGHEVLVICAARFGKQAGMILGSRDAEPGMHLEHGILVNRLPVSFELKSAWGYPWLNGLEQSIIDFKPDVVHCHGLVSISAYRAARICKNYGCPFVLDNHTAWFNFYHPTEGFAKRSLKKALYRVIGWSFGKIIRNISDAIIAIGEPEQEFAAWFFNLTLEDILIIRLAADHTVYYPDIDEQIDTRRRNAWNEDLLVLGHAGTLRESKRIVEFIQALETAYFAKFHVDLVGHVEDRYAQTLRPLLSKHVTLTGFLSQDSLRKRMNGWDIAVWPGDISITALEAMATGKPLVALKTTYTEQIVGNYSAGILLEDETPETLVSTIQVYTTKQQIREIHGINARLAIESSLNWEAVSHQFTELYSELHSRS